MAIVKLQNQPGWWQEIGCEAPTIVIQKGDLEWEEAYANWLDGKNPTASKEWKKGIYASCQISSQ